MVIFGIERKIMITIEEHFKTLLRDKTLDKLLDQYDNPSQRHFFIEIRSLKHQANFTPKHDEYKVLSCILNENIGFSGDITRYKKAQLQLDHIEDIKSNYEHDGYKVKHVILDKYRLIFLLQHPGYFPQSMWK